MSSNTTLVIKINKNIRSNNFLSCRTLIVFSLSSKKVLYTHIYISLNFSKGNQQKPGMH